MGIGGSGDEGDPPGGMRRSADGVGTGGRNMSSLMLLSSTMLSCKPGIILT